MIRLICLKELMLIKNIDNNDDNDTRHKEPRRCIIYNFYYFLRLLFFRFQTKTCDGFRDLMQKDLSFTSVEF